LARHLLGGVLRGMLDMSIGLAAFFTSLPSTSICRSAEEVTDSQPSMRGGPSDAVLKPAAVMPATKARKKIPEGKEKDSASTSPPGVSA